MIYAALLVLCYLSLFCLGLIDNSRAATYPLLLRDFGVGNAEGALFFTLASGCQLLSTLASRWWLPRWRPLGGLTRFLILGGMSTAAVAGAATVAQPWGWYLTLGAAVLMGLAMGGLAICQNSLVTVATRPEYHRRAYSGLHTMYGISSLLAPVFVSGVMAYGWRWSQWFLLLSLLPLALAFVAWRQNHHLRAEQGFAKGKASALTQHQRYESRQWAIALLLGVYVIAEVGISSRLVLYGMNELGLSQVDAGNRLSLFFLGLMGGRLLLGLVHVPLSSYQLLVISTVSSLIGFTLGLTVSPWFLSLCGLLMSPFFPTAMAWMAEHLSRRVESSTALIMLFQGVMLMLMHQTMGSIEQGFSVHTALWLGPLALGLTLVGLVILPRLRGADAPS
jgi:FHS family glucose/mannose:H+ symporter-like MFS transporter